MGLTAEQKSVLTTIIAVANKVGATPKEKKAAVETAITEANLTNPTRSGAGDGTSLGWRQETASSYPGVDRTNVREAAKRFFSETKAVRNQFAKAGNLAQGVQRSAYPDRYAQHSSEAQSLLRKYDPGNKAGGGGARAASPTSAGGKVKTTTVTTPGVDNSAQRRELLGAYLDTRNSPDALLNLAGGLANAQDVPGTSKTVKTRLPGQAPSHAKADRPASSSSSLGGVKLAPGADRSGVSTQAITKKFVGLVAGRVHNTVTIGTGTNHSRMTVDGNVSDHWTGHAADIPVPVDSHQGNVIAAAALELVGVSPSKAHQMVRQGGLWTFNPTSGPLRGHRIQIIWRTNQGGNHHNHVHLGIQ